MEDGKTRAQFSNRQFVAAIRAELDAAGRPDVAISRQWIDEDQPGYRYLVHVPVGSALTVPIKMMEGFFVAEDMAELRRYAREFATALVNLKRAEKTLERYARDVRTAATARIASARAEGLDILLEGVGFKPTYAYHLNWKDWKEAASHVLASVRVRHTCYDLRPTTSELWVEEPEDVAKELADVVEGQRERQRRIAELEALGADLIVDRITLDLLAAHGLDAEEMLERVWKTRCVNLTVRHEGRDIPLSLSSFDGAVKASITLDEANWNGEYLWFLGDEAAKDHRHLVGGSLGDLVRHPAFASRPVVDVFHRLADHVVFDLSDKVMFDADTGLLREEERLVA